MTRYKPRIMLEPRPCLNPMRLTLTCHKCYFFEDCQRKETREGVPVIAQDSLPEFTSGKYGRYAQDLSSLQIVKGKWYLVANGKVLFFSAPAFKSMTRAEKWVKRKPKFRGIWGEDISALRGEVLIDLLREGVFGYK